MHRDGNRSARQWIAILLLSLCAGALAACNTVQGMGRDVEKAGEKIQEGAESVKRKL